MTRRVAITRSERLPGNFHCASSGGCHILIQLRGLRVKRGTASLRSHDDGDIVVMMPKAGVSEGVDTGIRRHDMEGAEDRRLGWG